MITVRLSIRNQAQLKKLVVKAVSTLGRSSITGVYNLLHNSFVFSRKGLFLYNHQNILIMINLCRKHGHYKPLKGKRSSSYSKDFGCCGTAIETSTRKDVLVRNPKNVHFAKRIIVGNRFRHLLKALYRDHSKDAQAIKRKINGDGHFQLSKSKGEDEDAKVDIYNIEDKSDASKNKTVIELRAAILKLLDKVVKKAKSTHIANQKDHRQNFPSQRSEKRHSSKSAKTEIQESYKDTSHTPLNDEEELSAKRANYLDLLNFIARMKTEIGPDLASRHRLAMPTSLTGVDFNGLNGMVNTRDMMKQNSFPSMPPTSDDAQNGLLPGNGLQMQEMNLAEQRKLIEDQMENHIAQLQMKAKLQEDQQDAAPVQNPRNFPMSNFMGALRQTPMTTQSDGPASFGFRVQPIFHQPSFFPRVNPYLPFARPFSRLRTGLPFFRPVTPRVRYPLGNEDEDDDDDDADDDSDYDRDRDEPPPHHLERGYEDDDKDDVDEEQSDAENDER